MIPRLNWLKVGTSLRERGTAFQASAAKFIVIQCPMYGLPDRIIGNISLWFQPFKCYSIFRTQSINLLYSLTGVTVGNKSKNKSPFCTSITFTFSNASHRKRESVICPAVDYYTIKFWILNWYVFQINLQYPTTIF